MATHLWVIDKVSGDKIVLVCDDGRAATTSRAKLPPDLEGGVVLAVENDATDQPDWSTATVDREETERRRQQSAEIVRKLRNSDQHGFIQPPE